VCEKVSFPDSPYALRHWNENKRHTVKKITAETSFFSSPDPSSDSPRTSRVIFVDRDFVTLRFVFEMISVVKQYVSVVVLAPETTCFGRSRTGFYKRTVKIERKETGKTRWFEQNRRIFNKHFIIITVFFVCFSVVRKKRLRYTPVYRGRGRWTRRRRDRHDRACIYERRAPLAGRRRYEIDARKKRKTEAKKKPRIRTIVLRKLINK